MKVSIHRKYGAKLDPGSKKVGKIRFIDLPGPLFVMVVDEPGRIARAIAFPFVIIDRLMGDDPSPRN